MTHYKKFKKLRDYKDCEIKIMIDFFKDLVSADITNKEAFTLGVLSENFVYFSRLVKCDTLSNDGDIHIFNTYVSDLKTLNVDVIEYVTRKYDNALNKLKKDEIKYKRFLQLIE